MSKEDNENYNDEEYHFAIDPDEVEKSDSDDFSPKKEPIKSKLNYNNFDFKKFVDIKKIQDFLRENVQVRNAIIAVVVLILLIVIYQFTSGFIAKRKESKSTETSLQQPLSFENDISKRNLVQESPTVLQSDFDKQNKDIKDSLAKLKESQDNINNKISTISSDNYKLSSEYQELSDKLNSLSQQIDKLSSALEDQSQSILSLSIKRDSHPQRVHRAKVVQPHFVHYFVKAVIPGRAWLIGENGSTMTVRKGSIIPGYGLVTMVDVSQGRVLTNSGKVITFAQNDS